MWNLIRFFVKNGPFFTWLLLTILSILLLCQSNPNQRKLWYGSANAVVGCAYEMSSGVTGYFGLRTANEELLERNGQLMAENLRLRKMLQNYSDSIVTSKDTLTSYSYLFAHVVSNSINQAANYITLDKGSADGVCQDQGVADHNGVVGIVSKVSKHYALVISLLNPHFRLSASIKNSESFGSLIWDGDSPAYALLEDLPRNVKFAKGDTIVTTSYSTSFPAGVPVGTVVESYETGNSNFLTLRIKLFTDFNRLKDVHVIANADADERKELLKTDNATK